MKVVLEGVAETRIRKSEKRATLEEIEVALEEVKKSHIRKG